MRNKFFGVLALGALAVVAAGPVFAQSVSLTATIPFEFVVGNETLPAGDYVVKSLTPPNMLQVRNDALRTGALAMAASTFSGDLARTGDVRLVFNQYGSRYVLFQVWDGLEGVKQELPKSRTEQELARTASVKRVAIQGLVARR